MSIVSSITASIKGSIVVGISFAGSLIPAGYTILRQIDGKPLKQNDGKQLYGKLP